MTYFSYFNLDLSSLWSFLELPPYLVMWNIFINGGWIIILILLLWIIWHYWLFYIRKKYAASVEYILLTVDVPKNNEQGPEAVERLFAQLGGARSSGSKIDIYFRGYIQPSFSFELVSLDGYIRYFIHTPVQFRDIIEAAIYTAYPEAAITEAEDYTTDIPDHFPDDEYDCWAGDLVLYNKDYYPIRTYPSFEHSLSKELKDPLGVLLELMGKLQPGEHLWTQLILTPISNEWKRHADSFIKKSLGIKVAVKNSALDNFFGFILKIFSGIGDIIFPTAATEAKEEKKELVNLSPGERKALEAAQDKASQVGFLVKLRAVYVAKKDVFSKNRGVVGFLGAINQFNTLDLNGFKPDDRVKTSRPLLWGATRLARKQTRLMRAYKTRNPRVGARNFILNIEELATLYHFPVSKVKAPLIQKTGSKRGEPPLHLPVA